MLPTHLLLPPLAQESIIPQRTTSIKNKRDHQLYLHPKNLKLQSLKRIDANDWRFSQKTSVFRQETFPQLLKAMKSGNNIQKLHLQFSDNYFASQKNRKRLSHMTQTLKSLSSLHTISLIIDSIGMNDAYLAHITQELGKISHLKNVILCFFGRIEITDEGLCQLSKNLKRLKSLKKLTIKLHHSKGITSAGLQNVAKTFKKLKSLSSLSLEFRQTGSEMQEGLETLSKSIISLNCLEFLSFEFYAYMRFSHLGESLIP